MNGKMKAGCVLNGIVLWSLMSASAAEDGLVAHWAFDEGAGAVLHDRSGQGNDGEISGAIWVRNGKTWALAFDGVDDFVDCGTGLDLREKVSLLAWVRAEPQRQAGEPGIIGKRFSSYVITQYHEQAWSYISGGGHNVKAALPSHQWVHLASTYDGKVLKLYVDGELRMTNPLHLPIQPGGHFWMAKSDGERKYTQGAHLQGMITDAWVYRRALSLEEIVHHFQTTNLTGVLGVALIPVPSQQKLLVVLDRRGLGRPVDEAPEALSASVELFRVSSPGKIAGGPLRKAFIKRFGPGNKTTVSIRMGELEAGKYQVRASPAPVRDGKTGLPGTAALTWAPFRSFPHGPSRARQLNNLVTELLNVPAPESKSKNFTFVNPRAGWLFFSNYGSPQMRVAAAGASGVRAFLLKKVEGAVYEGMYRFPAGKYRLSTPIARGLIVRAVPELIFARYDSNPHVKECGPYQGEFQRKYLFNNVNTFVGSANEPFAREWREQGGRWLVRCGVPKGTEKEPLTVPVALRFLEENRAFGLPQVDGLIADEYGNSAPDCAVWAKALNSVLSRPENQAKVYYPYANNLWNGKEGRELVAALVKHGSSVAWKQYLKEQRTESEAWRFLNARMVEPTEQYRQQCPGVLPRLAVCFGYFSAPPEQLDTFPHVNYKTWLDMQFNLVANHPAFERIGGLMTYLASYADEETVRWGAKLFRHYGIEGKTEMLCRDPYILDHLKNPDFEKAGTGWTLKPAEKGTIRFGIRPGFGWLQGRYPRTSEGDTVLISRRTLRGPNIFSQRIKNLEPGRFYSLRMYSGDFNNLAARQKHALTIRIENATILPERSFTHINANCYSHHFGPFDRKSKAWMNYHFRVFRAKGNEAALSVSDWAGPKEPGGPVGQELMFNFVQVQPYDGPR